MLIRNIPDGSVRNNTSPHHVAVTVTGILDQTFPAYLYFDLVRGWVKQPLSLRQQAMLTRTCPKFHADTITADFDRRYRQRLQLPQPSEAALRLLIDFTGDDMLVNGIEKALDLLPPDQATHYRLCDWLPQHFLQPWHKGYEMQFWFDDGFSTRPFTPGQSQRGHYFYGYGDQHCRIDGQLFCVHLQSCVSGAQFVRRLGKGIHRPSDLLPFDFVGYFSKWLRLYQLDFERLGRFDVNRRSGGSRRTARLRHWGSLRVNLDRMLGGGLYQLHSLDQHGRRSLQQFVNSYGRGRYLTRIPVHISRYP
jgi:hypothetical protein